MKKLSKIALSSGGFGIAVIAFAGIAFASGVGPSLEAVRQFITGPEPSSLVVQEEGCERAATSTGCVGAGMSVGKKLEISPAVSYTEVAATHQSDKVDEHLAVGNTLKSVSFCSQKTFKTRQITINGVDVVQRIAQLASNDQMGRGAGGMKIGEGVCNSMPGNANYTKGILDTRDITTFESEENGKLYRVYLSNMAFAVNPKTNEIFIISAYDGSTLTGVGKLK